MEEAADRRRRQTLGGRLRGWLPAVLLGLLAPGCHEGTGSDIGPNLGEGPDYDYRVLVRDDAGTAVVGARISIQGVATTAATGHTGRAFLREFASGDRRVTIDGTNAAATDASRLGTLTVAASLPDGDELPYVVYLPDHSASAGSTVSTGVQGGTTVLSDLGTSGAELTVAAGETVTFGAAASVELRTAALSAGHLPGTLTNGGAVTLASRAIYIHPPAVAFGNGAGLSVPNDLNLAAAQSADLYWLDPATGLWANAGTAVESGGRIVATAPAAQVRNGGLYAFGTTIASTTRISGRIVDLDDIPIPGVLVRAPQASTRSAGDGRFSLPPIARTDAQGVQRTVVLDFHGGRDYLPEHTAVSTDLVGPAVGLVDDVVLATHRSTNVRLLLINRGLVVPHRRIRLSGREFLTDTEATIGPDGTASLEEIGADTVGYVTTVQRDYDWVFRSRGILGLSSGLDNPFTIFSSQVGWRQGLAGGVLIEAMDSFGTGALKSVHVVVDDVPGEGYAGETNDNGYFSASVPVGAGVTAVMQTDLDGRSVRSAFTAFGALHGRNEFPIERVRRDFGAFRRFGMLNGSLTGLLGSNTLSVRTSGEMTRQEFYDQAVFGRTGARRTPVLTLPTPGSPSFLVGSPAGPGFVAGVEGTTTAGVFVLEQLGVVAVNAVEGAAVTQDVALAPANTVFRVRNAIAGLHPSMSLADLRFDLAGQLDSGLLVDLVRDVGGSSVVVVGNDVTMRLPPLPAGILRYVAVLRGTSVSAGVTRTQQIVADLDGLVDPDVSHLEVPEILSPAPGSVVSAAGFTVQFQIPWTSDYGVLRLRSDTGSDVRDWTVVVPRFVTEVNFFILPTEAPDILEAGRTWTLSLSTGRVGSGSLLDPRLVYDERFARILANWIGMGESDRQENGFSRVSFTVTTN